RIIAQVVIVGTQVFGRAFVQAWKQAAANSARVSQESSGSAVKDAITKQTGITIEESCQILNIKKPELKLEDVLARHKAMFEANDPAKGGSFYIQSKVLRAKERLEMELSTAKAEAE
ncbi:mitochondrial import inner membrane translocase subunit tim16, partial [Protomyces lactucae-debilis]